MNKKEMINKTIAEVTGGKEAVAAVLGMSVDSFNNHLYEKKGSRFFSVDELVEMADLTKTPFVAEYFAKKIDCVVVPLPDIAEMDKQELYDLEMWVGSLFGELNQTRYQAELDGVYDDEELKQIDKLEHLCLTALLRLNMTKKVLFTRSKV